MGVVWKGSGVSGNRENSPAPIPSTDGEYTYSKSAPGTKGEVSLDGGPSGNREDGLPNIDQPFNRQVPQDTSGGSLPSSIHFKGGTTGNSVAYPPPPVPWGGSPDDGAV